MTSLGVVIEVAPELAAHPDANASEEAPEVVIGIVGRAGSGKTRLALEMAARLHPEFTSSIISFKESIGNRARHQAREGRSDRRILAEVGAEWVSGDAEGLVRDVWGSRTFPSRLVLVDGVHHVSVLNKLKVAVGPATLKVIHLKAPKDAVLAVATNEDETLQPSEVFQDSTEHDVDRELLATANLVLDGSASIEDNAAAGAAYVKRVSEEHLSSPAYVGGLDADQREGVVVAVEEEFGWLLPSEVADAVNISYDEAQSMIDDRRLFAIDVNGAMLCPGFVVHGTELNPAVVESSSRLRGVLSDWELASWFMSGNGYLDDHRPIDPNVRPSDLVNAIEEELDF